jgi:hypothetical protein
MNRFADVFSDKELIAVFVAVNPNYRRVKKR